MDGEFLKHEQNRIRVCQEWSKKFLKTAFGKSLDIGSFYVVPAEGLSSSWKAAIADFGNYMYFGLSVLANSPLIKAIALLPYTRDRPLDYKLIEITKSKRANIIKKGFVKSMADMIPCQKSSDIFKKAYIEVIKLLTLRDIPKEFSDIL